MEQFINRELVDVAEKDSVIKVAKITTVFGHRLICSIKDDFLLLVNNVQKNTENKFYKLSVEEQHMVLHRMLNGNEPLVKIVVEDMLKSEYDKNYCATNDSMLFCNPG